METGGLPYLTQFNLSQNQIDMYLEGIYNTVLLKDIEERMNRKQEGIKEKNITDVALLKSIAVFTTEKSLSVNTGESMWLAFGLMDEETGLVEEDWRKMAVVVSDSTVISLSNYEETEYGYSLEVIGKKEGSANVTITDSRTWFLLGELIEKEL